MQIETTINGGLPVKASADVCLCSPDEYPGATYIADLEIRFLSGHDYPKEISDQDESRIAHEIISSWREGPSSMPDKHQVKVALEIANEASGLPDGAYWQMVHDILKLEYGDVFPIIAEDPRLLQRAAQCLAPPESSSNPPSP